MEREWGTGAVSVTEMGMCGGCARGFGKYWESTVDEEQKREMV